MTLAKNRNGTVVDPRGDQSKLKTLIAEYGEPGEWGWFPTFLNHWRLIVGAIQIRLVVDMAMRGGDQQIRAMALRRLGGGFDVDVLDRAWPGVDAFDYGDL